MYPELKICRFTVTEPLRMEGTSGDHLVQPPSKSTVNHSSLLGFWFSQLFISFVHPGPLTV